jgi:hypothetical protein
MKVRPVKTAPVRAPFPTAAEAAADPSLLAPAVRRGPRGAGALLGTGLLGGLFALAAVGTDNAASPLAVLALTTQFPSTLLLSTGATHTAPNLLSLLSPA